MQEKLKYRQRHIQWIFILTLAILILNALYLQVIDSTYRERAQATAMQTYVKYPSRGLIYDRNGKLLINNEAIYDLLVTFNQLNPAMDTTEFCRLLDISKEEFERRLHKDWRDVRFSKSVPFVFMSKVTKEAFARFQESLYEFPGFFVQIRNMRTYPEPYAAHLLGYISEVDQNQIDASDGKYTRGDYIGSSGLELAYEDDLKGVKGKEHVLKDNLGRIVDKYKEGELDVEAEAGADIYSTIDATLQIYGEQLMQNKTGSIVAIEPATGEILAMISAPSYDPNLLAIHNDRGDAYNNLLQDSLKPFFDRAVMAKYPPGSIFKPIMALIGLQEGVIRPNTYVECNSGYFVNGRQFGCHSHTPATGVHKAIQHSCNAYFFHTLRLIIDNKKFAKIQEGMDTLSHYLSRFGLGKSLGVDFPNEKDGFIPSGEYYNKLYPDQRGSWRSSYVMSIGIGQGEVQLTTIQMANMAATIANKGYYVTPHLLRKFEDNRPLPPEIQKRHFSGIKPFYFPPVIDGMELAVAAGTGRKAFVPGLDICGKTGTSQNPQGEDHSVFFAFAPKQNPKIAIAVYVENAGWGGEYAAPIAGLMIEKYLNGEISENRIYLEELMKNATIIAKP